MNCRICGSVSTAAIPFYAQRGFPPECPPQQVILVHRAIIREHSNLCAAPAPRLDGLRIAPLRASATVPKAQRCEVDRLVRLALTVWLRTPETLAAEALSPSYEAVRLCDPTASVLM